MMVAFLGADVVGEYGGGGDPTPPPPRHCSSGPPSKHTGIGGIDGGPLAISAGSSWCGRESQTAGGNSFPLSQLFGPSIPDVPEPDVAAQVLAGDSPPSLAPSNASELKKKAFDEDVLIDLERWRWVVTAGVIGSW